jgi:hypothetical protein
MKHPLNSHLVRSSFGLALALILWSPVRAQSTEPAMGPPMSGGMMAKGSMADRHAAMMAEMKSQDAELTAAVATMNSAPQDKKLDLLASIVTRLVQQRVAMDARMQEMHEGMMKSGMGPMPMCKQPTSQPPTTKSPSQEPAPTPPAQK